MDYTRWSTYTHDSGPPEPPSRWRWVKDATMLAVAAFFLGVSLGTWVSTGVLSKLGVTVGTLALLVMAGVMGLGQFIEATRYDRLDLMRISALGSTAFVITVLATITAHM